MDLKHSNSDKNSNTGKSSAFFLLNQKVQRWIYKQGWKELRDIQEQAVEPIISGTTDVIIASPTASGKTEAAFLPACSGIIEDSNKSIQVLYIAPLKALINDQYDRLSDLCEQLNISVHKWHGDVPQNKKKNVLEKPTGILLITPESLEAIFCNHGTKVSRIFSHLSYIVIDELHSFIGLERGRQLQSLMHRSETFIKKRVPRIGLSATLGDMQIASGFLRPGNVFPCCLINSRESRQEIKLQLRGYRFKAPDDNSQENKTGTTTIVDSDSGDTHEICNDLFKTLRGTSNLVFANARTIVEEYSDLLRRMSELKHVPNEFFPHHGSLSKELREDVEARLKDSSRPLNVVCTTTLEMGIDIGSVTSIAQVGSPPSVASMRQRLGRSGRRGEPAILRIFVEENEITERTWPHDQLREDLVQSIAMVELLIEKWCEPPISERLHLSTLVQQIMSTIAQLGGIKALDAWRILCGNGPFQNVSEEMFSELLRNLGKNDLIAQMSDGTLILGLRGERIVNHYEFYAAFNTSDEYILISEGKTLGSIPISYPLVEGIHIIFAGKRWEVIEVDQDKRIVTLVRATGGRPPKFGGGGVEIHDRIRQKMFEIYKSPEIPVYLDRRAVDLLEESRANFYRFGLDKHWFLSYGQDLIVFLWRGSQVNNTLQVLLNSKNLKVLQSGFALIISNSAEKEFLNLIEEIIHDDTTNNIKLASTVANKLREKYDYYLTDNLLDAEYAARSLNIEKTKKLLMELVHRS